MRATSPQQAYILSALLLAGCSSADTPERVTRAQKPGPAQRPEQSEKYQDCMREMRGDVFAERTCDVYLKPTEAP